MYDRWFATAFYHGDLRHHRAASTNDPRRRRRDGVHLTGILSPGDCHAGHPTIEFGNGHSRRCYLLDHHPVDDRGRRQLCWCGASRRRSGFIAHSARGADNVAVSASTPIEFGSGDEDGRTPARGFRKTMGVTSASAVTASQLVFGQAWRRRCSDHRRQERHCHIGAAFCCVLIPRRTADVRYRT